MISLNAVTPGLTFPAVKARNGAAPASQDTQAMMPAPGSPQVDSFSSNGVATPAQPAKRPWYKHPAVAPAAAAATASFIGSSAMHFISDAPGTTSKLLVPATVAGLTLAGTAFATKLAKRQNAANQPITTDPASPATSSIPQGATIPQQA